jgi:hypothetical protein
MGLSPRVRVSGPGEKMINSRLLKWQRIDTSGEQSDQLTLTVDTAGQTGLPFEGGVLHWFEGYDDKLVQKGTFKITRITPTLFPPSITIVATSAPFQIEDKTRFKERRTRSFENITLGELCRQVISAHGFSPRVTPEFEMLVLTHVDQVDETDGAFLSRLARERDAIAKPVEKLYVLARKGQVKTMTGKVIPPVSISLPTQNSPNSANFVNCQLDKPSKQNVSGVKAKWSNNATGAEHEVTCGVAPFKKLRQPYESAEAANQAVRDELIKVKRKGSSVKMDLPGDPLLVAEGILTLADNFPSGMGGNWSIDKITASGSKSGYRCAVVATQPAD